MNRIQLPIESIIVLDRQREVNLAKVADLAENIKSVGLIQPIVINQDKRLIAGGHRLAACKLAGLTHIDVVYRETLSEAELQELELYENIKRSDLTWQERCMAVAKIHELKKRSAAKDSKSWGQKETGEMLGISQGHVSYSIIVARALRDQPKDGELWQADGLAAAWSIVMRWQQELAERELAKRHNETKKLVPTVEDSMAAFDSIVVEEDDKELDFQLRQVRDKENFAEYIAFIKSDKKYLDRVEAHWLFANRGQTHDDFLKAWESRKDTDLYWEHRCIYQETTIDLSSMYHHGDSIAFMLSHPSIFDHIITDIPYGIDIEHIDQHVGMKDITTIKDEHTVEGNESLFESFFPAAFTTLKDNAFLITWCDIMQWQRMYDLAIAAGFKVQRWPITWSKSHSCLNQMAQYNFTKSTEIAMVCRKGNITLVEKQPNCVISAGRDDLCDFINHPFAKPFTLWERLMLAVSIENQYILDPFAGRGSSLLTGIKLGRKMCGVELNDAHYNAGLENLKTYYTKLNPKTTFI